MPALVVVHDEILASDQASFDVTSIPAGYAHLRLVLQLRGSVAAQNVICRMRFNNASGASDYDFAFSYASTTLADVGALGDTAESYIRLPFVPAASATSARAGIIVVDIPNYAETDFHKGVTFQGFGSSVGGGNEGFEGVGGGTWFSTAAIDRITISPVSGDWLAGSRLTIYALPVDDDLKISELTEATSLADTDEFVIASSGTSKRITKANLSNAVGRRPFLDEYLRASGSALNDEFDGGPAMSGAWTLIGTTPAVESVNDDIPDHYYGLRSDTASQWSAYYQAAPAAPFTIAAHVRAFGAGDYQRPFGLWIADATPTTGETNLYWGFNWNGNFLLNAIKQTPGGSYSGSDGSIQGYWIGPEVWLRVDVLAGGTTYDAYFSFDGYFWTKFISAAALGYTAGACGFAFSPESSGYDVQVALDWFRCDV